MTAPLAGLFFTDEAGRSRTSSQTFVAGALTSWDAVSGQNVVTVGDVTYNNCTYLLGDALAAGSTVLLAFTSPGSKPTILARLRKPTI